MTEPPPPQRVVLITGATSGIGKVCAEHLAGSGWRVFGAGRRANVPVHGAEMLVMDVDDDASVRAGVETLLKRAGRLDAVVNNAGFSTRGAAEDFSIENAKAQFETNFFGAMRVCQAVLPAMRASGGGHIVNMSSLAGLVGLPFAGLYSASKFALEGFSESLRHETRPFNIRVVLVEPGDFRTEIGAKRRFYASQDSVYWSAFEKLMQRRGRDAAASPTPEPIARLVEKILNSDRPKTRYAIGMRHQLLLIRAKRFLPQAVFEWALIRAVGL
ncbi:MAG TPA: SDR family oxidoreductase [Methylocystis sp.]|nr:SDR family oxidoreductase [Methylocystis sp.]